MKNPALTAFLLISMLPGAPSAFASEPVKYVSAHFNRGEVCFLSPVVLDAEGLATKYFKLFPLSNPDRRRIAEASQERASANFTFTAPLDGRLLAYSYFVLHEAGIDILELKRLEGSVIYDRWSADPVPSFEVMVCGEGRSAIEDSAFVAITGGPPGKGWNVERLVVGPDRTIRIGTRAMTIPESSMDVHPVRAALTFIDPTDKTKYLLVRRMPAFCESPYDLFTVGTTLAPVLSNYYHCDL